MKVVVTGAAGFIGSHTVEALATDDRISKIVAIDSFTDYYSRQLKRANVKHFDRDRVDFHEGDLDDLDLRVVLDDAQLVYHLAGQPGVRKSWGSEFNSYVNCNIDATQRLLEAALKSEAIRSVVYASSSSVYGDAERYPTNESDRPAPRSPYGVTKLAGEHLCSLYAGNFGLPVVSLRYFTVYGPRQRPDMAFNKFIRAILDKTPVSVYGDGHQIREFTYVGDIVRANILAAEADLTPGEVLNVSGGSSISVRETISVLEGIHGSSIPVVYEEAVAGDVFRTGGSAHKAQELLGWRPTVTIDQGLAAEYEWLRSTSTVQ